MICLVYAKDGIYVMRTRFSLSLFALFLVVNCGGESGSIVNNSAVGTVVDSSKNDDSNSIEDSILFGEMDNSTSNAETDFKVSNEINLMIDDRINYILLPEADELNVTLTIAKQAADIYLVASNYSDQTKSPSFNGKTPVSLNKRISEYDSAFDYKAPRCKSVELMMKFRKPLNSFSSANRYERNLVISQIFDVGDTETFYIDEYGMRSLTAVLKKREMIDTSFGSKALEIWVADDLIEGNCTKAHCIDQNEVDMLAEKFLRSGSNNDIYDYVTHLYGEEWGDHSYSNLIADNDTITILLLDIDNDNATSSGVIGFFYEKDNFLQRDVPGSNERVMFYIDGVMYGDESNVAMQKEIYSTIVHEFTHLVQYYQKRVAHNMYVDVWLSEMIAEATEDLLATKIDYSGPRNVDPNDGSAGDADNQGSRYNYFNSTNDEPLLIWRGNYGLVGAFGAYLLRNYGGAPMLREVLRNDLGDESAIVSAIKKITQKEIAFSDLMRGWGIAYLLSDGESVQEYYRYNVGDFFMTYYNGVGYELGSINFFNYTNEPKIDNATDGMASVYPYANRYYKITQGAYGTVNFQISGLAGMKAAIVVK